MFNSRQSSGAVTVTAPLTQPKWLHLSLPRYGNTGNPTAVARHCPDERQVKAHSNKSGMSTVGRPGQRPSHYNFREADSRGPSPHHTCSSQMARDSVVVVLATVNGSAPLSWYMLYMFGQRAASSISLVRILHAPKVVVDQTSRLGHLRHEHFFIGLLLRISHDPMMIILESAC